MAKKTVEFECPKCHRSDMRSLEDTLNAAQDPSGAQRLVDGTYFRDVCQYCGAMIHLTRDLLYHDPSHHAMCFLCTEDAAVKEAVESIREASRRPEGKALEEYAVRIVTDERRLQEKAFIWQMGYDDKAVEMWKLTYLYHVVSHREDFEADESYVSPNGDGLMIDFYNKGDYQGSVDADPSLIADVQRRFLSRPTGAEENDLFVDQAWAMQHLTNLLHRPDDSGSGQKD